jgi:hypothetical protein
MTDLLKRLHIWVGLFNLTALLVFALTGLWAVVPDLAMPDAAETSTVAYSAPGDFSDQQVAADLFTRLRLPLAGPVPEWAVRRNDANVLVLTYNSVNGAYQVTVDEPAHQALVAHRRNRVGEFLSQAHGTTLYRAEPDLRVRLWALYIDLSILGLLFMTGTGLWLWLTSRPRVWWAWLSFAGGAGLFAALWIVTR